MNTQEILEAIDAEIRRLEEAKELLNGGSSKPGRSGKRTMSAEGRARVAAAQQARWARQKRAEK